MCHVWSDIIIASILKNIFASNKPTRTNLQQDFSFKTICSTTRQFQGIADEWGMGMNGDEWGSIFTHSSSSRWMGMNKGWIIRMRILFILYSSSIHGWIKDEWIGWGYYSKGMADEWEMVIYHPFNICPGCLHFDSHISLSQMNKKWSRMNKGWIKDE